MQNGILLLDKPSGMTSFGVVARIRRVLSQQAGKKVKVGHTGTLDPFATGLMILVTGAECKNAGTYTKLDKVYEATICLGKTSSTGDPEGEITEVESEKVGKLGSLKVERLERERIVEVLRHFTGTITQTPPIFSAIKINGQRAYDLARKGQVIDMPSRQVTVYSLDLLDYTWPYLKIRTHVSSGTYIRSLAADIGAALGTGAYCTQLRRTKIADWDVATARTLVDFGVH